jgi:malonyl-CoA O-methyltransferase
MDLPNRLIEVGCGTGKNTEFLARIGERLHAIDFSEAMIARAREKCRDLSSVTFSVADIIRRWPAADHSADLVTCNLVLEHVREMAPVFSEAGRVLAAGGTLFVSELHPFRQYIGGAANFSRHEKTTRIPAFVHHVSDFLDAARTSGFRLKRLQEWWHDNDDGKPPRLLSFLFENAS